MIKLVYKPTPPPKISVIIPVYNCEKYIRQAIESVLNQTFKDYELIVVDDGSTDKTKEIILDYPITTISKINGGTASALNVGIRHARGQWIKWLSADDEMHPNCLEILSKNAIYADYIYYTNYDIIDDLGIIRGQFIEPDRNNKSIDELKQEMMNHYYGNGSTSFIHKTLFDKIGYFDELPHSEDYEFMLRALSNGIRMELIPEKTIRYRYHIEQLTHKVGGSLDYEIKKKYA